MGKVRRSLRVVSALGWRHAPGPWKALDRRCDLPSGCRWEIVDAQGRVLACINNADLPEGEAECSANLMALAPCMLEALLDIGCQLELDELAVNDRFGAYRRIMELARKLGAWRGN